MVSCVIVQCMPTSPTSKSTIHPNTRYRQQTVSHPPSRPPSSQSSTHDHATALHFQRAIETSRQTQTLLHRPPTVAGGDGALDAPTHFRAQNPSKK